MSNPVWRCIACEKKLPRCIVHRSLPRGIDPALHRQPGEVVLPSKFIGSFGQWGRYWDGSYGFDGRGTFCTKSCAYAWANRMLSRDDKATVDVSREFADLRRRVRDYLRQVREFREAHP